jgi:hypothetical protein
MSKRKTIDGVGSSSNGDLFTELPNSDATYDLGSSSKRWRYGYFSNAVQTPSLLNTGTLTLPTSTDTLIGRTTTDTLTNKTLTSPKLSSISNTGTLTLPTSTDTLIGRTTTDTLTNKTLTSPTISSILNTGTLTLPTSTDTLVGRTTTDTLTNKTLTSPTINSISVTGNVIQGDVTTQTWSTNWSGPFSSSIAGNCVYNKIGNLITCRLPATMGTSTSGTTISSVTAMPSGIRPTVNLEGCITCQNGATSGLSNFTISTSGVMTIYWQNYSNFAVSGTVGFYNQCIQWNIL